MHVYKCVVAVPRSKTIRQTIPSMVQLALGEVWSVAWGLQQRQKRANAKWMGIDAILDNWSEKIHWAKKSQWS